MSSRAWLNLTLLVLAVATASVAFYQPGINKPPSLPTLTQLAPEQITRIHITREGQEDITLIKHKQGWTMATPLRIPANPLRVDALLRVAQVPSQSHFPVLGQKLSKFGLDPPRVRLRLNDTEIAYGAMEPLNHQRYVLTDNIIHLIFDTQQVYLTAAPTVWASNNLLPAGTKIDQLGLPDITLSRQKNGRWSSSPATPALSADNINALVDDWTYAQALQVRPYEGAATQGPITLHLRNIPAPVHFYIIARAPEFILARMDLGIQYHLPAQLADRLLKPSALSR
jgi:hypothetical protein